MKSFNCLEKYKDNIAIICQDGEIYTYSNLVHETETMGKYLPQDQKKLFFILCDNNIESVIAYLTVLRNDQAAFLVSNNVDRTFLNNLIIQYRPDYIWGAITLDERVVYKRGKYNLYMINDTRKVPIYKDLNLLLSTSGSTGSSKLVKLTGDNLQANAHSIADYLEIDSNEIAMTVLPMNYSYGLSIINSHLIQGAKMILTNYGVTQKEFWKLIEEYKPTSLCGVPYTYEMYMKLRVTSLELPSVKTFTQAGGKLFQDIAKEFAKYANEKGKKFFIMYGQTEATARISYLPAESVLTNPTSIGRAIPGGRLYLQSKDGEIIRQPNVIGEMVYEGPNVMLGYATKESDLEKGDERKGVLKTGDLGYFDEVGFFYITGRNNRNVKICGNRINLDEVEKMLQTMNFKCYVGGEDEKLEIVTQEHNEEEVRKVIQKRIHVHPSQVEIFYMKEVPRNEYGKVSYAAMFRAK